MQSSTLSEYDSYIESLKVGLLPSSSPIGQHFMQALKNLRRDIVKNQPLDATSKKNIITYLSFLGIDYSQNDQALLDWLSLKAQDLISWNLYSKAYYKWSQTHPIIMQDSTPNTESEYYPLWSMCQDICVAYRYFNDIDREESTTDFLMHPPYDYTRPHGWYKLKDYISIGEVLAILYSKNMNKTLQAAALTQFVEYHRPNFPQKISRPSDLFIPYSYYSKCFDELSNYQKAPLQPHSVEICFYYVQQNGLPIKHVSEVKAPENHLKSLTFGYYYCPSFKFFDLFDLQRFLQVWERFIKISLSQSNGSFTVAPFLSHCKRYFDFSEYPDSKQDNSIAFTNFCWLGVRQIDLHITYKQILTQTLSFLGDVVNGIGFALTLEAQIMICQKMDQSEKEDRKDWSNVQSSAQRNILSEVLKKYNDIKDWLEKQSQKENNTKVLAPVWPCNQNDFFLMISTLPRSTEVVHLEKALHNSSKTVKDPILLHGTLKALSEVLKYSDLSHVTTKDWKENAHLSVHALASLSSHPRPHLDISSTSEYKDLKQFDSPTLKKKEITSESSQSDLLMQSFLDNDKYFSEKQEPCVY